VVINFFILLKTLSHSADIAGITRVSKAQKCRTIGSISSTQRAGDESESFISISEGLVVIGRDEQGCKKRTVPNP
jgi:hypothetical protein